MKFESRFEIVMNHARSLGDFEPETSVADLDAWENIVEHYSNVVLHAPGRSRRDITIDWKPAADYAKKVKELYAKPRPDVVAVLIQNPNFFEQSVACKATVSGDSGDYMVQPWLGDSDLKHMLYEIYLVANIAVPGCFNLYRSHLQVEGMNPVESPFAQTELELSEYQFENAWHEAQKTSWIDIKFIPFESVLSWYRRLNINLNPIATTGTEKALFALLHLGRTSFLGPDATLWIASALEGLFRTPHGTSFTSLHKRISAVLNLDAREQTILKKKLRGFYDIRNGFSHGGGVVCHPLAQEGGGAAVDKVTWRTLQCNDMACSLLLNIIQIMVLQNVAGFTFEERHHGVSFPNM